MRSTKDNAYYSTPAGDPKGVKMALHLLIKINIKCIVYLYSARKNRSLNQEQKCAWKKKTN